MLASYYENSIFITDIHYRYALSSILALAKANLKEITSCN